MVHGSALDAAGQRLFLTLALSSTSQSVGVVDLRKPSLEVIAETEAHAMYGMHYHAKSKSLVSVAPTSSGLSVVSLSIPHATWAVTHLATDATVIYGNYGVVSALDVAHDTYHVVVGKTTTAPMQILTVDVSDTGRGNVIAAPTLTGLPLGTNTLDELVWFPDH